MFLHPPSPSLSTNLHPPSHPNSLSLLLLPDAFPSLTSLGSLRFSASARVPALLLGQITANHLAYVKSPKTFLLSLVGALDTGERKGRQMSLEGGDRPDFAGT